MSFLNYNLDKSLCDFLVRNNINNPTKIQALAIPVGVSGRDILASSETGSGKTLAYLLPLVQNLLKKDFKKTALVLAPTREIASQIHKTVELLGYSLAKQLGAKAALLIGGQSMLRQIRALEAMPRIVVGTPGRVFDHLQRGSLNIRSAEIVVLDEFDRMLDIGFYKVLESIVSYLPANRQTLMFSATISPEIEKLSKKYLSSPEIIIVNADKVTCSDIKQELVHTSGQDKFLCLLNELESREGAVIVFSKTKIGADKLAERLKRRNYKVMALHGNLRQNRREQVLKAFKDMKSRILVATDIAARGIDIAHVKHIVNYDLPQCPEDYVHRIGRTGRAGNEGFAVSFVTPEEQLKWKRICRLVGVKHLPVAKKFVAKSAAYDDHC